MILMLLPIAILVIHMSMSIKNSSPDIDSVSSKKSALLSIEPLEEFSKEFVRRFPLGTKKSVIDSYFREKDNVKISERWHWGKSDRGFVLYQRGEAEDHYLIAYFKVVEFHKRRNAPKEYLGDPIGEYFILKYSLDESLINVVSRGKVGIGKAHKGLMLSMFKKEEIYE